MCQLAAACQIRAEGWDFVNAIGRLCFFRLVSCVSSHPVFVYAGRVLRFPVADLQTEDSDLIERAVVACCDVKAAVAPCLLTYDLTISGVYCVIG